jgi:diguanylate cyclase (GGDEF)-like protein
LIKNNECEIDRSNNSIYALRNSNKLHLPKAIDQLKMNLEVSKDIGYLKGIVDTYRILGIIYAYNGQASQSLKRIESALEIYRREDLSEKQLADIYSAFVFYYLEIKRDYKEAAKYCQKGLPLAEEYKINSLRWKFNLNLGVIYLELDLLNQAKELFLKTLEIGKETNLEKAQLYAFANLADLYYKQGNLIMARDYQKRAKELAIKIDDIIVLASLNRILASIESELGNDDKACVIIEDTINKLRDNKQDTWLVSLSLDLVECCIRKEDYLYAKEVLDEISKKVMDIENDKYATKYFKLLSKFYEQTREYNKALENFKQYHYYYNRVQKKQEKEIVSSIKAEALQETIDSLEVLSEIGKEIASYTDLDDVFLEVNKHISNVFENYNFVVAIKEKTSLNCIYYKYQDKNIPSFSLELNNKNSFLCATYRTDETLVLNDLLNEHDKYVKDLIHLDRNKEIPKSLLSIPLKVLDETIGVLQIQAYRKNAFNNHNIQFFSIIASYTAIAIRNSIQAENLKEMANNDSLTGLRNWHYFNKELYEITKNAEKFNPISLIIIDIDHFKKVNDTHGHNVGNECLKKVAEVIKEKFEETAEVIARIGGEEFGIITTKADTRDICKRSNDLLKAFRDKPVYEQEDVYISISIGSAINTKEDINIDDLFDLADSALYEAKENGRDQKISLTT